MLRKGFSENTIKAFATISRSSDRLHGARHQALSRFSTWKPGWLDAHLDVEHEANGHGIQRQDAGAAHHLDQGLLRLAARHRHDRHRPGRADRPAARARRCPSSCATQEISRLLRAARRITCGTATSPTRAPTCWSACCCRPASRRPNAPACWSAMSTWSAPVARSHVIRYQAEEQHAQEPDPGPQPDHRAGASTSMPSSTSRRIFSLTAPRATWSMCWTRWARRPASAACRSALRRCAGPAPCATIAWACRKNGCARSWG